MSQQVAMEFRLRSYQRDARVARAKGYTKFIKLWHRRAGKDRDSLAFILEESMKRIGNYIHLFPSLNQGRRDIWNNKIQQMENGVEVTLPMLSMFPKQIVKRWDQSEMFYEFHWGSTYQVMGADDEDAVARLRGPNPIGIVPSEYAHGAYMKKAYDTLIPIVAENGGWIMFPYTPNGVNHGKDLWDMAVADPEHWFTQKLTIDETRRDAIGESGGPVVPLSVIEQLRREGVREEFIQQEFYCSFTGYQHGTIYGDLMLDAENQGRIKDVPYIVNYPVGVIMDLGQADAMAVWFYQLPPGGAIHFIDYWQATQKSIKDVVRMLREQKPYIYGRVVLPWDGRAAADYMWQMGFKNVQVSERTKSLAASIDTVRTYFPRFYFDRTKCADGIRALQNYKRKYDEETRAFSKQPVHDEHSHGSDALRTGIEGGLEPLVWQSQLDQPVKIITEFDPREMETKYGRA